MSHWVNLEGKIRTLYSIRHRVNYCVVYGHSTALLRYLIEALRTISLKELRGKMRIRCPSEQSWPKVGSLAIS